MHQAKKLNLGSADRHVDGFVSVDRVWPVCPKWPGCGVDSDCHIHYPQEFELVNLSMREWPWPNSSIEEILAQDIIEHLPDRIHTMNEMWRVLKPGARAVIEVPNAAKGSGFVQDPTHVSPWCMNSFQYFESGSFAHQRFARSYGIKAAFKVVDLSESQWQEKYEITYKIHATLEAVK